MDGKMNNGGQSGPVLFSYDQTPLTGDTRSTYIRLIYPCLRTLEDSPDLPLSFELKSVSLNDNSVRYVALSYCWGSDSKSTAISLNGHQFNITPSLGEALDQLYKEQRNSLPIWIDQISIDQSCVEEKNAQVLLMSKIYRNAERVLVWLGPSADGSNELMDNLAIAAQKCKDSGMEGTFNRVTLDQWHKWTIGLESDTLPFRRPFRDLSKELLTLVDVRALTAWFLRPWFHRVWTVQEFCLAKESILICGDKSIPADDVNMIWIAWTNCPPDLRIPSHIRSTRPLVTEPTAENLQKGKEALAQATADQQRLNEVRRLVFLNPLQALTVIRKQRQKFEKSEGQGHSLFGLLKELKNDVSRTCTDKRDWIYGLTALTNDVEQLNIAPDYSPSCDVISVYCQFARKMLAGGNFEVLRYSRYPKSFKSNFPSWVPGWDSLPMPSFDYRDDKDKVPAQGELGYLYHAGGGSTISIFDMNKERSLGLGGWIVDEIEELGTPWLGRAIDAGNVACDLGTISYLTSVRHLCLLSATRNHPIYPSAQRRSEAIWRVPIADLVNVMIVGAGRYNARATPKCEEGFNFVWAYEQLAQQRALSSLDDISAVLSQMLSRESENGAQQYRMAMSNVKKMRPFMTRLGYVGLGPRFIKDGDKVVVFKGAATPFIVRPRDEGYSLLGEAYCDGIMDGEIVGQRQEETIVLV